MKAESTREKRDRSCMGWKHSASPCVSLLMILIFTGAAFGESPGFFTIDAESLLDSAPEGGRLDGSFVLFRNVLSWAGDADVGSDSCAVCPESVRPVCGRIHPDRGTGLKYALRSTSNPRRLCQTGNGIPTSVPSGVGAEPLWKFLRRSAVSGASGSEPIGICCRSPNAPNSSFRPKPESLSFPAMPSRLSVKLPVQGKGIRIRLRATSLRPGRDTAWTPPRPPFGQQALGYQTTVRLVQNVDELQPVDVPS